MKADTIFRFVALRAPALRDGIVAIPGDDEAQRRIRESLFEMEGHGIRRMEARRLVGQKILRGGEFWSAIPHADLLVRSISRLRAALQQQAAAPDRATFLGTLRELTSGLAADMTPGSKTYSIFRTRLWLSYYAITLNPSERAQDLPILREWLKGLYLANAADADTFDERARQLRNLRLTVPFAWLAHAERPERAANPPSPSPIDALQKRINELRGARATLNALLLHKLQALGAPDKATHTIENVIRISGDPERAEWWRIAAEDQKAHSEALGIASAAGIDHEELPLPDIVNSLDDIVATLTFRLRQLRRRSRLLLNGKIFVRVR